jgi:hypothetical protein
MSCQLIHANSSPSPPPTYDGHGRRTNTREVRYRKKLEDERIKLVDKAMKNDPNFRPPVEYHQQKRSQRPQEKVYIPVKEFPEINFFGLLVGPRGNSLKKMERESGAKISIRGKGSVKEGKARPEAFADDAEEELHCLITGEDMEKVRTCVNLINKVIETVCFFPSFSTLMNCSDMPHRLPLPPKVKTTTNGTSCASSPHSTARFVMTRTKSARIAGTSVIASTTARNSATTPPTLSAGSAAARATWPVIVARDVGA